VGLVIGFLNAATYAGAASVARSRRRPSVSPPSAGKPSLRGSAGYPSSSSVGMPWPVAHAPSWETSAATSPGMVPGIVSGVGTGFGGSPSEAAIFRKLPYAVGGSPFGHFAKSRSTSYRVWLEGAWTSTPASLAARTTAASRVLAYGSVSVSKHRRVHCHRSSAAGITSVGLPCTTTSLEPFDCRVSSRSRRDSSRNRTRFAPTRSGDMNHGSSTNTGITALAPSHARCSAGLSCTRRPFRNQSTERVDIGGVGSGSLASAAVAETEAERVGQRRTATRAETREATRRNPERGASASLELTEAAIVPEPRWCDDVALSGARFLDTFETAFWCRASKTCSQCRKKDRRL
jgi:hypothetical protein